MVQTTRWTHTLIDSVKRQVKAELDGVLDQGGPKKRLAYIHKEIKKLESSVSSEDLLRLFVLIVSALLHHKQWGGLLTAQIKKLASLGYHVLQIQGVQPETSQMGFLYGEIHMALSQIFRQEGQHRAASWQQDVCKQVAKRKPPGGAGYQTLAKAIRGMRLGQVSQAFLEYKHALTLNLNEGQKETALMGQLRSLRLLQRRDEANHLIQELKAQDSYSRKFRGELDWETVCLEAMFCENLEPMIHSVQKSNFHHQPVYLLEAYLWVCAWPQRKWLEKLPKIRSMIRKKDFDTKSYPFFVKANRYLEQCFDKDIPLIIRIKDLGSIFQDSSQFLAIDRELLYYVAASRWLAKSQSPTLASTILGEYEGLCLKITRGQSNDVFRIAGDLYERGWYTVESS
ncbi:MAG: hypothetical protein HRU19_05525 [Pseudobacteriovorax sp.]|nr:hypothetical protein [Pseudobacteriovorax sp.]